MKYIVYAKSKFCCDINKPLEEIILGKFENEEKALNKIEELSDKLNIQAFFYTI